MEVNFKSLESLQAYAYRILAQLEAGQNELRAVNQLIKDFKPEEPIKEVEAEKVEETICQE